MQKDHLTTLKMTKCMTTACTARYIFRSQNALKLTYVHVQFQKFSGGDAPGPPSLAWRGGYKTPLRQNPGYGPGPTHSI